MTHYHFIYDYVENKIVGKVSTYLFEAPCVTDEFSHLDCEEDKEHLAHNGKKNFPLKCFYKPPMKDFVTIEHEDHHHIVDNGHFSSEIYLFYREANAFIINGDDTDDFSVNTILDQDLGQMYLLYNEALMVRSSSEIIMFKIREETNKVTKFVKRTWFEYSRLSFSGPIFHIKGDQRIQVVLKDKIQFWNIDEKTLVPALENIMSNHMKCSQLLYGPTADHSIAYQF